MSKCPTQFVLKVGSLLVSVLFISAMPQVSISETLLLVMDGEAKQAKATDLNDPASNDQAFSHAVAQVEQMSGDRHNITLFELARNLNEAGLLTDATYEETIRDIEQRFINFRSQLLSKLLRQDSPRNANVFFLRSNDPSVMQAVIELLNNDLDRLNSTGVLTASVYEFLRSEIASGNIFDKLQMYMAAQTQLKREESVDPDLLRPRLEALRTAGILSEQGHRSLLEALEASALQNPIEILNYIERAQMFDLIDYSVEPALYFPAIYQSVAQMLLRTGVVRGKIGEFSLKLIPDQEMDELYSLLQERSANLAEGDVEEWRAYDAVVSAQIDNRNYEQSSYYSPSIDERAFLGLIDSDGIIHLFNKVLRDQSSPYRLFAVQNYAPHIDYSRFGVIALTKEQADVYLRSSEHRADYTSPFTSDRISEIVTLLSDINLLAHLSADEVSESRKRIARQYITRPQHILSAFDDVVLLFDWESAGGKDTYKQLLESLSDISHGSFNPTDIDDNFDWENQTASIAFTVNGTRYSTDLDFQSDWLDPYFFEFVEGIVDKEVLTGKFYPSSEELDGVEGYIFLNDRQLEALRSQQLITFPTDR